MKKMIEKTAVDLKLNVQADFTALYLGAREKISKHITKSTIISMSVECACSGKPAVMYDDAGRSYTFGELKELGVSIIRDVFSELMDKSCAEFCREMEEYELSPDIPPDDLYRELALKIFKQHLQYINHRESDWENIVKIILISEDDLREGVEGESGTGSYMFLKYDQPFTFYRELSEIVKRYHKLSRTNDTLQKLFALFSKTLERISADKGYTWKEQEKEKYYDFFDGNMKFFKEFSQALPEMSLTGIITEEELKQLRSQYVEMLRENGELQTLKHCGQSCDICVFDVRKCADIWIKQHLINLLERLCFVDGFKSITLPSFEESLFSKEYRETIIFKEKQKLIN